MLNMETKVFYSGWEAFEEEEEGDDALSLCNLTMRESEEEKDNSSAEELFEFSNAAVSSNVSDDGYHSAPDIVFCGKIIQEDGQDQINEYQKRDYLTFRKPQPSSSDGPPKPKRTSSTTTTKSATPLRLPSSASRSDGQKVQKINITTLTSMSAKSRRRMFMFGPVKFKPEMELSAIKERQSKRLTTLLSPTELWDGEKVVVSDNDEGKTTAVVGGKKRRSHWGMVKSSFRGRAHLNSVLARSFVFGCIPAARTGNLIKVGN